MREQVKNTQGIPLEDYISVELGSPWRSARLVPLTMDSLTWTARYSLSLEGARWYSLTLEKYPRGDNDARPFTDMHKIRRGARSHHTAQKLADSRLVVVRMAPT